MTGVSGGSALRWVGLAPAGRGLLTIHAEILASGSFTVTSHRMLLVAVRNQ